jgi:hypothetical protein
MQVNLNKPLIGLDGVEAKDPVRSEAITLGKLLAGQLANHNQGDPLKLSSWAMKLYNGKPIMIPDKSDLDTLKTFIKTSQQLTNLMKAQMLEAIDEAEEAEEKEKEAKRIGIATEA